MNKRIFITVIILNLILQLECIGQDNDYINRKLNIELSIYGLWSQCEPENISGDIVAEPYTSFNTGNMLRFEYEINKAHSVFVGLNYYRNTSSINYTLDKDQYNLPFDVYGPTSFKAHVINIPISYSYQLQLASNAFMYGELGYFLSLPLIFGDVSIGSSIAAENGDIEYLAIEYSSGNPAGGILAGLGFKKTLKKNEVKLSLLANIPVTKKVSGTYTFFPNNSEYISSGNVKTGYGYIGLGLSYVFTHKQNNE